MDYLRSTGILDAYGNVVERLVSDPRQSENKVHERAAQMLLKWKNENTDKTITALKASQIKFHRNS